MRERILVIDDDSHMRQIFAISLNDAGWDVVQRDYASIDLPSLQGLQPDLIILSFPKQDGGDGWAFLQLLKMNDATAQIPILITASVFAFSAEIQSYLLARYIQVVYQPFDLDGFVLIVRRTLTLASQMQSLLSHDRTLPILLVEDTDDLRDSFETILMLEGYHVVTAANGLMALNAVYQADYCLIFLDLNMPVMDGFEFLRLYDQQLRPHTPVIILTADLDVRKHTLPSFVVDVLRKPFEIHQLLKLAEHYTQPV